MAVAKKQTYITADLEWAETNLSQWKAYIDKNPIAKLKDRVQMKQTKTGTMPMVVASIEQQIKSIRDTMKEYLAMLEVVNKLRSVDEEKKKSARGGHDIPEAMEDMDE